MGYSWHHKLSLKWEATEGERCIKHHEVIERDCVLRFDHVPLLPSTVDRVHLMLCTLQMKFDDQLASVKDKHIWSSNQATTSDHLSDIAEVGVFSKFALIHQP